VESSTRSRVEAIPPSFRIAKSVNGTLRNAVRNVLLRALEASRS